jgi:6-pyruvoyltetrahydropterin/6-carboxytetrahydropterin synthase
VYRFEISKDFPFEAGHVLRGMPEGHKCGRPHGHSYIVRITLGFDHLNEVGFVQDYGDLDPIKKWIDSTLDHRFLNTDVPAFDSQFGNALNPTAENIAAYIYEIFKPNFPMLRSVAVSETAKAWATYRPEVD